MGWFWDHVLVPALDVLYVPCDGLLGWTSRFGAVGGVTIVGILSGILVILLQKYASNQKLLAACKADLTLLKLRMRSAKASGDADALARAQALQGRIGGRYMVAALKPSLWTVPAIGLVGLWCGSRLGYEPVRPGTEVTLVAHFEDEARGFAHAVPEGALGPGGAPVAAVEIPAGQDSGGGKQARWTLRAESEGNGRVTIVHGGRTYAVEIPVASKGGRPPGPVTVFESSTPSRDALQALEVKLRDSMPAAWWNLGLQWGGLYLLVAVGLALLLRFALRVQ